MKVSQYQVVESDWIRGVFRKQWHDGSCLFILFHTHVFGREYQFSAKRGLGSEGVVKMQIGGIDGHVKQ
jgi:hypothetical protein